MSNIGYPRYGESWLSGITNMAKTPAIYRLSPIYHFWHFWCDFCNFCVFFSLFCIFWVHFFGIFFIFFSSEKNTKKFLPKKMQKMFFASSDRRRRYLRYRDNIGYPRYGESYNIGDNQYSSKNLLYCPINRFLGSVPFPTGDAREREGELARERIFRETACMRAQKNERGFGRR